MKSKKANIRILTKTIFLAEESSIEQQRFLWTYEVTIINESDEIVQLLNRYWSIVDMAGKTEEIRGPGVVGLQPIIKPGRNFVYNSFCQLQTPQGTMTGQYEMQNLDEVRFLVEIPKFILTSPAINSFYRSKLH